VLIGAILAVIVLLMFLGNLRATLVTAIIIPATVLITFLLMRLSGLTLNLMTLGALAVGIGLVIDDAIVVVENVFRHLSHGEAPEQAVVNASQEIAAPMISSTLTTVVVFLPLILVSGVSGAFFTALSITLAIALMVSLALALLVSPSLCAAFLRVRPGAKEHGRLFERFLRLYDRILRFSLHHKWLLSLAAAIVIALTIVFGTHLTSGFMPEMDEGAFVLDYVTPPGTTLEESDRLLRKIEDLLKETPEVEAYSRRTGTELGFAITEPNTGDFAVTLKPHRKRSINAVMDDLRDTIQKEVPGVDIEFHQVLQDLIGDLSGAPSPIEIKLFGEDQAQLKALADTLKDKVSGPYGVKGLVDATTSALESGPELVVRVDSLRAGRLGLTTDAIATQVNAAMFGDVVTQIVEGDHQVGVRVRFPLLARGDRSHLALMPIHLPSGPSVPLSSVAAIESVPGTTEVNREDQRRMVSVSTGLADRDLGSVKPEVEAVLRRQALPPGVSYVLGGLFQSQSESFSNLLVVLALAVLLVFAVMLFQFGDFTAPIVILLVMPLSLFGVTFGLWATKTPLNVSSFMGAIMLVGIVVKNAIVLIDRVNQLREAGVAKRDAIAQGAESRLRPIVMTTLCTLIGFSPLAIGVGEGAEVRAPMAITVIGGLAVSTLLTLVVIPVVYDLLDRRGDAWYVARGKRHRAKAMRKSHEESGEDEMPGEPEGQHA
jgi:CzcA family heavy metal efflux pump